MKLYKLLLPFLFFTACFSLSSQTIQMSFPDYADRSYYLVLYFGQKTDTVVSGKFNSQGKASLVIPASYKNYCGVSAFSLTEKEGFMMVINNENFSVTSGTDDKLLFRDSPENTYLLDLLSGKPSILANKKMYAQQHFDIMGYMAELRKGSNKTMMDSFKLRSYLRNDLNMEALYHSGLWNHVISAVFGLYIDHKYFGEDMVYALRRTTDPVVFNALSQDLISICEQFGWSAAEDAIVGYLVESGRVTNPAGRMKMALELYKVRIGTAAPKVEGESLKNVLLVFHETGCHNCDEQMQLLRAFYKDIVNKGYDVVSVASDIDEEIFKNATAKLPWKRKYRDNDGFDGVNFRNYGVLGTPTMYMIDSEGKIAGRYARLQDIEELGIKL